MILGKQHALSAVLAGVGVGACVPDAPWPVRVLVVAVTGGAGLLPDLDHPGATAARSLGFVTKLVALGVDRVAVTVYHATRASGDSATRQGGHRTLTHTVPWSLLTGVAVAALGMVSPVALVVTCALLGGLLSLGLQVAGVTLAGGTGAVAWWVLAEHPSWWPLVPVSVTVGCLVHIAGDMVTTSGVPVLWPLVSQGQRWRMVTAPVTFSAGDHVETALVAPLLVVGVGVAVASVTGVLPVLVSTAVTAGGF